MLTLSILIFGFIPMVGILYFISKKSYHFKDLKQLREMAVSFLPPAGIGFIYYGIRGVNLLEILVGVAFLGIGYYDLYKRIQAAGGKEGLKEDPLYIHYKRMSEKVAPYVTKVQKTFFPDKVANAEK